jgi:hypothetical protein
MEKMEIWEAIAGFGVLAVILAAEVILIADTWVHHQAPLPILAHFVARVFFGQS